VGQISAGLKDKSQK